MAAIVIEVRSSPKREDAKAETWQFLARFCHHHLSVDLLPQTDLSHFTNHPSTKIATHTTNSFATMSSETDYVTLISSDGFSFIVQRSSACLSPAIKRMLDPACTSTPPSYLRVTLTSCSRRLHRIKDEYLQI